MGRIFYILHRVGPDSLTRDLNWGPLHREGSILQSLQDHLEVPAFTHLLFKFYSVFNKVV